VSVLMSLNLPVTVTVQVTEAILPKEAPLQLYLRLLPVLQRTGVLHFHGFFNSLAADPIPWDIQRLRCRCMFHALRFLPRLVTSHESQVTSHKSPVTSQKSRVTRHKSKVVSQELPPVAGHGFPFLNFFPFFSPLLMLSSFYETARLAVQRLRSESFLQSGGVVSDVPPGGRGQYREDLREGTTGKGESDSRFGYSDSSTRHGGSANGYSDSVTYSGHPSHKQPLALLQPSPYLQDLWPGSYQDAHTDHGRAAAAAGEAAGAGRAGAGGGRTGRTGQAVVGQGGVELGGTALGKAGLGGQDWEGRDWGGRCGGGRCRGGRCGGPRCGGAR